MNYQAINNRIIVKQKSVKTSTSGIIYASPVEGAVIEVEVVATTDLTKQLQGTTICVERRHCAELDDDGENKYASVKVEDVIAVKS